METLATLLRWRNGGDLTPAQFLTARTLLRDEVLSPDLRLLETATRDVLASADLVLRHNLNASDAAILETFLRHVGTSLPPSSVRVLVAADKSLLRAARAEGLQTLDPEALPAADVPDFLARLSSRFCGRRRSARPRFFLTAPQGFAPRLP